jgi:glycosyltransferase involved in cell wall biosynthesis
MKVLFIEEREENPGGGIVKFLKVKEKLSERYNTKMLWLGDDQKDDVDLFTEKLNSYLPVEVDRLAIIVEPRIKNKLKKRIEREEPDIIIAQKRAINTAVYCAKEKEIPVIGFVNDFEYLYDPEVTHEGNRLLSKVANYILRPFNKRYYTKCLDKVDEIVFNSHYTAEMYGRTDENVVYTPIEDEDYRVDERGEKILHVNASEIKGIDVTLDVAKKMTGEEFLVVGRVQDEEIKQKMEEMENVEYGGYYEDMREVYKKTKIVLVPSRIRETFGRIPAEAAVSGIPAVSSTRGGLSEPMPTEELMVEGHDPDDYVEKIREIEENYEKYSEMFRESAEERSLEKVIEKHAQIIEKLKPRKEYKASKRT